MGADERYLATFGPLELRFTYRWYDTSKAFSIGPDRTRLTREIIGSGKVLDEYRNSYDD
jgi:hypothetical protein